MPFVSVVVITSLLDAYIYLEQRGGVPRVLSYIVHFVLHVNNFVKEKGKQLTRE